MYHHSASVPKPWTGSATAKKQWAPIRAPTPKAKPVGPPHGTPVPSPFELDPPEKFGAYDDPDASTSTLKPSLKATAAATGPLPMSNNTR